MSGELELGFTLVIAVACLFILGVLAYTLLALVTTNTFILSLPFVLFLLSGNVIQSIFYPEIENV